MIEYAALIVAVSVLAFVIAERISLNKRLAELDAEESAMMRDFGTALRQYLLEAPMDSKREGL